MASNSESSVRLVRSGYHRERMGRMKDRRAQGQAGRQDGRNEGRKAGTKEGRQAEVRKERREAGREGGTGREGDGGTDRQEREIGAGWERALPS
eukprot:204017-Hanusia_phi.AAC.3